ncbi:unnamed protein product, partial [Rotaria magnacalcarata]
IFQNANCVPTKSIGSIDNLRDNRANAPAQDDTLSSVFLSLAGTIKDITESPYFPKMAFKKLPSRKKMNI